MTPFEQAEALANALELSTWDDNDPHIARAAKLAADLAYQAVTNDDAASAFVFAWIAGTIEADTDAAACRLLLPWLDSNQPSR